MGGPAAGVLLRERLNSEQIEGLRAWVTTIADTEPTVEVAVQTAHWRFSLPWPTLLLPGVVPDELWPLSIGFYDVDAHAEYSGSGFLSPEDWQRVADAIGWMPAQDLEISAYCNSEASHRLVAWLSAEIADQFRAVVDVGGKLPELEAWLRQHADFALLAGVPLELTGGRLGQTQILNAFSLRAWLTHPSFHMIK